jgi:hypothetical protein
MFFAPCASTLALAVVGAAAEPAALPHADAPANGQHKPKTEVCPWCKNDPEVMKKAGIVSHGPIPIGAHGSASIVETLPAGEWVFLETAHLRWASSLGATSIELEDKKRIAAELARLHALLPSVPIDARRLDPFLRLHLFAMKAEEEYARFQKLLGVTDADFPESRRADKPFMGDGKYLGEKEKYEVLLHAQRATHNLFTQDLAGVKVTGALRYHSPTAHKILISVPAEDADLKKDKWLYPHVVHNLSHAFFCGYKHFSYDPPPWLDEGLACAMEKEVEPASTTNEGEEGAMSDLKGPKDWSAAVKKIVASGKAKPLAELMHVKTLDSLDLDSRITCWSMVRFLIDTQPEGLAKLLGAVKGQLDEKGYPTGKDLSDLTRRSMREAWSWTTVAFDEAWKTWVTKQNP